MSPADALPPRRPELGHYNATRDEWVTAYRAARIDQREGRQPNPAHSGVRWKAALVVAFDRNSLDPLSVSLAGRAEARRIVNDILRNRET